MATLTLIIGFIVAHWDSISIVLLGTGGLVAAVKNRAYALFLTQALELVRKVAIEELSGPEKRKKVVEEVYKVLPLWAKNAVSPQQAEVLAERAYQLLRGELKATEKAVVIEPLPNVDPTVGVLDEENLQIKSPYITKE